jgi:hypothetical protein
MVEISSEIYTQQQKKFVKVFVKDNGFGIKEQDKPKLFNLFGKIKQKKSSLNREGIGFGLTICKQICIEFGGDIDFDSVENVGSTFFFTFEIFENKDEGTSFFQNMDSDMISTVNGENSVDGVHNWNESGDESSLELDQSQATNKKLIKNHSYTQSMVI